MTTRTTVLQVASDTGFRPEVVEKVLRLNGILGRLLRHEMTRGAWLLKGGTALNLLHLDVPRLSVDIDLNFVGSADADGMRQRRPDFERGLAACCEREGCSVQRSPAEHAGGKFRLRFQSVIWGGQNLEVDVNYVARIPLFGITHLCIRFPNSSQLMVPTLSLEELAAGKFAALVDRTAARDAFDAVRLLELAPDLMTRLAFRVAFVCTIASARRDARSFQPLREIISPDLVARDLVPLLRPGEVAHSSDAERLSKWLFDGLDGQIERLLTWSPGEMRFLDRLLDQGEIEAEALSDDPALCERIGTQPMLLWKAQHVRAHRGKG